MAIKFEKIKEGMVLYDRHTYVMGNTMLRSLGEWQVKILSVDPEKRQAVVSWNGNRPETYYERELTALFDWSMYDESVAVLERGVFDRVLKVRKLSKQERADRAAKKAGS